MTNFTFSPPANISDFPVGSLLDRRLRTLWNWNLIGDTMTGTVGDPWNLVNDSNRYFYFNPTTTIIPNNAVSVPIQWVAFPNRTLWYFSAGGSPGNPFQLSQAQILELVDTGKIKGNTNFANGFPAVPPSACPAIDWTSPQKDWNTFGPPGPRGWQDEYCEWSVTRDPTTNKITSVMFTCENPDYWFTLWQVDPTVVLKIYRETISPNVQLSDLYLTDAGANPVVNPLTGEPAYNPINKWNAGTVTNPGVSGGAMHLTSPPNTLGAEVYLAAAATLLRNVATYDAQSMVCCSGYGQPFRNSDPHIGFSANQFVRNLDLTISLADPVGLYIQEPDWSTYTTPDGTAASDFWTVTRGNGPNQILHAVFAVPPSKGYTVADIAIGGHPIQWGGQIPQTFQIRLMATGFSGSGVPPQQPLACQGSLNDPTPQAVILIPNNLLEAYSNLYTVGGQVTNSPVLPAPILSQGQTADLALQCTDVAVDPTISFGDGITVTINAVNRPGNAAGMARAASSLVTRTFQLTIAVATDAAPGQRSVTVTNPGQTSAVAAPCFLTIVPAGWSAMS
jgi:hypothetical protein